MTTTFFSVSSASHALRLAVFLATPLVLSWNAHATPWQGNVEIIRGQPGGAFVSGIVFDDVNGDSRHQPEEPGIPGVLVSNGLDVVATDSQGRYQLAVRDDMNLSVVQPEGWQVPVNSSMIPQIAYIHKPQGSPPNLRFGGLAATGPAPAIVNFPLRRAQGNTDQFRCAIVGDSQTYSNHELSQFRDSAMIDLLQAGLGANDCMLYVGDVMGDDLGLLDRLTEVGAVAGVQQWLLPGNHDLDFDVTDPADSKDTWRNKVGPHYFAFEIGKVTFIALDNIFYPCGQEDMRLPGRDFCDEPGRKVYNVRVADEQLTWMENLLAHLPMDRLIVIAHHGPIVTFMSPASTQHQEDSAPRIFEMLAGREALSLSGHMHTTEIHEAGEWYEGWAQAIGIGPLPFRHIVAGAASGNWWQGDLMMDGDAHALQRFGEPKGLLMLSVNGTEYSERYVGSRIDPRRGQWVDINTPSFREWFNTLSDWRSLRPDERDPVPPLSINDLPDNRIITRAELGEGVWATANVWAGTQQTSVSGLINGQIPLSFNRTQQGRGEAPRIGADWADPFSAKRQLTVGRFAIESRSGIARNQGYEAYRGSVFAGPPQPQTAVSDRSPHLWRADLPRDLPNGVHVVQITSTDRNGHQYVDHLVIEVRDERPDPRFRSELFQ
jgi:hypothetical protein